MQANPCFLKQTLTKCANCVQSGKNNSTTMQSIQSLILPQTMSPDDSSLPVQAGFTRSQGHSLSLLCITFFRRFVCVPCLSASPLFPSFHLSSLSGWPCYGCHSGGSFGISKQRGGGVVFVLGGYLWPSRTFIWVAHWYVLRRLLA